MNLSLILLQSAGNGQPGAGGSGLFMIILLFVFMWLLMIRPQKKREKEEREMRNNLKKGDRVLFSGGIYGKIHSVGETTVEVEVSNGVILTVEKNVIQTMANSENSEEKK